MSAHVTATKVNRFNPLVSIIMPAYNASRYISEAIESAQAQSYQKWELIIIDDGSTDDTLKIALAYARNDNRIKVLPMNHHGSPSIARNAGLKNADGEMLTFLDADDRFEVNALEMMLEGFKGKENISAVYGFANVIDEAGQLQRPLVVLDEKENARYDLPDEFSQTWEDVVMGKIQCLLSALMVKKSTIDRVGLLDERWIAAEDFQFFVRLYLDNFEGVCPVPAYLYQYRVYQGSLTKSKEKAKRILEDNIEITDWMFEQADLPEHVKGFKSKSLAEAYRYLARERLINNQADLAQWMMNHAFNNKTVTKSDWFGYLLVLWLRSLLGSEINQALIAYKQNTQQLLKSLSQQFPVSAEMTFVSRTFVSEAG